MKRIFFLISLSLIVNTSLKAQNQDYALEKLESIGEIIISFDYQYLKINPNLSNEVSIDKLQEDRVFAYVNKEEFLSFLGKNIPWKIEAHTSESSEDLKMFHQIGNKAITEWDAYPTYGAYEDLMYSFAEDYPHLCRLDTIGILSSGRKLLSIVITKDADEIQDKPQFLYTSTMHGDEVVGYILMLRLIDHILNNYNIDSRITDLVDNTIIHINPLANPNGTYRGGDNTLALAIRYNGNFVDLNRNYKDFIKGDHPDGKEWQEETIAFMEYAQRYDFVMSANFHGGAELANYPWDNQNTLPADAHWWYMVAKEYADTAQKMSNYNGYFTENLGGAVPGVTNGAAWYMIDGGRQDYMNFYENCREITLEISKTKKPNGSQLPSFWHYNYNSIINYWNEVLYGFRGIVTDSTTSIPLHAKISILDHDFDNSHVYTAMPIGNYHRLVKAGTYSLKFEAEGYCDKIIENQYIGDKESKRIDVELVPCDVGIGKNQSFVKRIYPNPVKDIFHIETNDNESFSYKIFDILGREIISQKSDNKNISTIKTSHLKSGIYILRVFQNGFVENFHLIKD